MFKLKKETRILISELSVFQKGGFISHAQGKPMTCGGPHTTTPVKLRHWPESFLHPVSVNYSCVCHCRIWNGYLFLREYNKTKVPLYGVLL